MRTARIGWLVAGLAALALAGCGDDDNGGGGSSGGDGTVDRFAIASPEKRNDFGWNQQGVKAAQAVARERGAELDIADGAGYDNVSPVLTQLASGGSKLTIAHASGYNATAPDVAAQTGVPTLIWDNPKGLQKDLVGDAETNSQEGAYLAGVLAARTTKTNKLGIVISADDTNWNKQSGGFIAGARSVDPEIEILSAQIGQAAYADSAGGKRVTRTVIAGGADVIIGMGDGASFGMLQAIEQERGRVKFIDVIGDKTPVDKKKVLLSSVLWNFEPAFKAALDDIDAGRFGTRVYTLDLANDGIKLLKTPLIDDADWRAVEQAEQRIIDGQIDVPLTPKKSDVQALLKR